MKHIILFVISLFFWIGITQKSFAGYMWASEQDTVNVYQLDQLDTLLVCYENGTIYLQGGYIDNGGCYSWAFPSGDTHEQFIELYDIAVEGSGNYGVNLITCNNGTKGFRLIFVMPQTITQLITICQGETYAVGSNTYDSTGTYTDTLQTVNGCDSIVTTNLTVNSATSSSQSISGCQGFSITVGSNTYTTTGTYTDTLQTVNGCDSIVSTNLTINQPTSSSQTFTECEGFSMTVGSNTYTTTGIYTDVLVGSNGCDSTVTTNLLIKQPSSNTINGWACDNFWFNGTTYTTSGTYYDTLVNAAGCDSIVTLNITINEPSSSTASASICDGDSVLIGGQYQTTAGTYIDNLQTVNGCDSIVTTNLTINQPTSSSQTFTECEGFSMTVGSNTYTTTGIYTDVLVGSNGCDSTVTTNLLIKQPSSSTVNTSICQGDSAFIGGQWQGIAGTYYDTLSNVSGCDSIITTNLTVNSASSSSQSLSGCQGFSITIGSNTYTTTGTYTDTLQTVNGCDSVITTNLTVNPLPTVDLGPDTVIINEGQTATVAATANNADAYLWSTGDTVTSIVADSTGWYFITVTNPCGNAVDSVYLDVITSIPSFYRSNSPIVYICPNPAVDFINISGYNLGIESIEIFSQDGRLMMRIIDKNPLKVINVSILSKGVYFIKIDTLNGSAKPIKFIKT